jgi:hypothetical protein
MFEKRAFYFGIIKKNTFNNVFAILLKYLKFRNTVKILYKDFPVSKVFFPYFFVELNVGEDRMNPPCFAEHRTKAEGES